MERLIPIGYDSLCEHPYRTLAQFVNRLGNLGCPIDLDPRVLAVSHATNAPRPTIGLVESSGNTMLSAIRSFDKKAWLRDKVSVEHIVEKVHNRLLDRFPNDYCGPSDFTPCVADPRDLSLEERPNTEGLLDSQVSTILRELEVGTAVSDLCRRYAVTQETIYEWKNSRNHKQ
jgi:hypothetical protein